MCLANGNLGSYGCSFLWLHFWRLAVRHVSLHRGKPDQYPIHGIETTPDPDSKGVVKHSQRSLHTASVRSQGLNEFELIETSLLDPLLRMWCGRKLECHGLCLDYIALAYSQCEYWWMDRGSIITAQPAQAFRLPEHRKMDILHSSEVLIDHSCLKPVDVFLANATGTEPPEAARALACLGDLAVNAALGSHSIDLK